MKHTLPIFFTLLFIQSEKIFAQAGNLDATFDGDGIATLDLNSHDDLAQSVVVQPDGKIILAGCSTDGSTYDFALARFNSDGTVDNTFNGNGIVITPIGTFDDFINSVTLQDDGKIVAAGYTYNGLNNDFAVARYNTDGTLDTDFDTDGFLTTDFDSGIDKIYCVTMQDDGKIVVAGTSHGTQNEFALVRYNSDGSLDITFDGDGKLTTSIGNGGCEAYSVTIQTDGKIVVSGYSVTSGHGHITVARYNSDGTLDTSFSSDGYTTTTISANFDYAESVAVQPDDKIVAGGYSLSPSDADFAVVRYNSDGSADNSFSSDGVVTTNMGNSNDQAYSIKIQPDGKILIAGWSWHSTSIDFALARYTSSGNLDNTFSTDGKLTTAVSGNDDVAYSLNLQPDGKIVAAGYTFNGSSYDFAVVRYISGLVLGIIDDEIEVHSLAVYPNPAAEFAVLNYELMNDEQLTVRLIDETGRVIRTYFENEQEVAGSHSMIVDLPEESGLYSINILTSNGRNLFVKIAVQ